MRTSTERTRTLFLRPALFGLAAALTLGLSIAPADAGNRGNGHGRGHGHPHASAHPGNGHGHGKHWQRHDRRARRHAHASYGDFRRYQPAPRYRAHRRAPARFVVPSRIVTPHVYADYRYGQVYHRGHGHWHAVYRFPVYASAGLTWRPYDYCGDRVYATGSFAYDGPRFSLRIGF